jgi:hypothetical protein
MAYRVTLEMDSYEEAHGVFQRFEGRAYRRVFDKLDERGEPTYQPLVQLREWHQEHGWNCSAASEGLECCVDIFLENNGPLPG